MKKIFTLFTMVMMLAFSSQAAYYLVGEPPFGNGWDPSNGLEMTVNADGTYSVTGTVNGTIYFVLADNLASAGDWTTFNNEYRIGPLGANEEVTVGAWITTQKAQGNGSGSYKFTGTGSEYVLTYNPFISKFKIEGYVAPIVIDTYTVAGSPASVFGSEWDPSNTDNNMIQQEDGTYSLTKKGCELAAGTELAFKVVGNHDWGFAWPAENYVYTVEVDGIHDLVFTFNPENNELGFDDINHEEYPTSYQCEVIVTDTEGGEQTFPLYESPTVLFPITNITFDNGSSFTNVSDPWDEYQPIPIRFTVNGKEYGALEDMTMATENEQGNNTSNLLYQGNNYYTILPDYNYCNYIIGVFIDSVTEQFYAVVLSQSAFGNEQVSSPVITTETTNHEVIVTATGEGSIRLFANGQMVDNPYTIPRGEEDATVTLTAISRKFGFKESDPTTLEIIVPALGNGIEELINNGKEVASVQYYNILGQEVKSVDGMTIVVTTYTDNTRSVVKVTE